MKKKTYIHRVELNITKKLFGLKPLNSSNFEASKSRLREFDNHEEAKRKLAEAKNQLEAFIYKVNDLTGNDEFNNHAKEDEIQDLKNHTEKVGFNKKE